MNITRINTEYGEIANVLQLDAQLLGDYGVKAVNTRRLHEALGVGKDYSEWVKDQIGRLLLVEGEDWEIISKPPLGGNGGMPSKDYIVPIDIAKDIAMISNTAQGALTRQYFRAIERWAQEEHQKQARPMYKGVQQTIFEMKSVAENLKAINDLLDFSGSHLQKQAMLICKELDTKNSSNLLGTFDIPAADALAYGTDDKFKGATHLLIGKSGGNNVTFTEMAKYLKLHSTTQLTKTLIKLKYIETLGKSKKQAVLEHKFRFDLQRLQSGKNVGKQAISGVKVNAFSELELKNIVTTCKKMFPRHYPAQTEVR